MKLNRFFIPLLGAFCTIIGVNSIFVTPFMLLTASYDAEPSLDNDQMPNGLIPRGNMWPIFRWWETFDMRLPFGTYEKKVWDYYQAKLVFFNKYFKPETAMKLARYMTSYNWIGMRNRFMGFAAACGKPATDYIRGMDENTEFWVVDGNKLSFDRPTDGVWKVVKNFKHFQFSYGWQVYNPTQQFKDRNKCTYWAVPLFTGRRQSNV